MGEITAGTDPGQARQHLQQAVALAGPAGSRLVAAAARHQPQEEMRWALRS